MGLFSSLGQVGNMHDLAFLGGPPGQPGSDFQAGIFQGLRMKALSGGEIEGLFLWVQQ